MGGGGGAIEHVHINGVRAHIKRVEFKENVRVFFPQGQSKLSIIMSFPYYAGVRKAGFNRICCVTLQNRMWRKTKSSNAGSSCIGTDPNRNWNFAWAGTHIVTKTSFHNLGGSFSLKNRKLFSNKALLDELDLFAANS